MTTVTLKMQDELNGTTVERTIDGSNLLVADENAILNHECQVLGNDNQIINNLNVWINQRGNDQHETILSLISYKINK